MDRDEAWTVLACCGRAEPDCAACPLYPCAGVEAVTLPAQAVWAAFQRLRPVPVEMCRRGAVYWWRCGDCGARIEKGAQYCGACGRRAAWK